FFFSSRRRHTRSKRDWSSDVCSSDLKELDSKETSISGAKQLHGKELSYNNIQDANAAIEIVTEFEGAAAVAVKHMNPCGIGVGRSEERRVGMEWRWGEWWSDGLTHNS